MKKQETCSVANLVSIRIQVKNQQTRQGVTMGASSFGYLCGFFKSSAEFLLSRAMYKHILEEQVNTAHQDSCEACQVSSLRQKHNTCLQYPDNLADLLASTSVDTYTFQKRLAAKACERQVILEHPGIAYRMMHFQYRDVIEREL